MRGATRALGPLVRLWFRPRLEGLENLPDGPFLLVANHSGGMAFAEIASFVLAWAEHTRLERPLAGYAHTIGFRVFPLSWVLGRVGAIPSTYEAAYETLGGGVPILMFPGGDHEAFRPIWRAHEVDFGGRKGFLRIARRMNVPIVPMGIRGSHVTVPTFWRSRLLPWLLVLPRAVGVKRWPVTLPGLAGAAAIAIAVPLAWWWRAALAWAWLVSAAQFLPVIPSPIRMRIGAPLPPDALFGEDDASLDRALAGVEGEVQSLVDP